MKKSKIIIAALSLCAGCEGSPFISEDEKAIAEVQKHVAQDLKDPSSAQFRNVRVLDGTVCGEINGKNSYGAYAGFGPFYGVYFSELGEARGQILDRGNPFMVPLYEQHCSAGGVPRSREEQLKIIEKELDDAQGE